jgi:type I restriction enzyme M protein
MSEELLQRGLIKNPEKIGNWDFYNIGATSVKALKEYGIIRNVDYGSVENKKVDALIVQRKNVIAVIEYKKPSEFKTEVQKQKAIDQEVEVAQKLGAKIFIATDTQEAVWVNALTKNRIGDENGKEIKTLFDPKNEKIADILKKIYESINEESDNIKPKNFVNPTNLAKSIWQDIWSVSGATPENCLYTFVELFIFKYLSDLGVLKTVNGFYFLMEMYEGGNTNDEVLEYYANNVRPKIKELFPQDIQDKTTIINGTIFVSKDQKAVAGYSTTFKTVLNKFLKYGKLENIDYDFKSQLFESFLKESISKKNWGQFFTPLKVIRPIIEMAKDDIKDGVKICDPACGVGKFLLEPLATKLEDFYSVDKNGITPKISIHGFDKGFDKDEQKTIILAKANMLIYFSDLIKENPDHTKDFAKLFNESFTLKTNSILGTLSEPIENEYDLILTNPPYVTSGSGNLKDEIKKDGGLVNYYKINATGVEGLFIEWIIKALKPGGKAFIVIPDGLLSRHNDKNLRMFIMDYCFIDSMISLPSKTFFTTLKKTYILGITKKSKESDTQNFPIFTYLVSEIGETLDINRIEIQENDLNEAVILFNQFKGAKNHFKSHDERCKIVAFDWFKENFNKSWIIENLWDEETLIKLGIKEKVNVIQVDEFSSYLFDLSETIKGYQEQLDNVSSEKNSYKEIKLTDPKYFEILSGSLGLKKTQYAVMDTKNETDLPIYTATIEPVAYLKKDAVKKTPNDASLNNPHISFASDGDGTAGTNIVYHTSPYYINTSRISFKVIDKNILPEYVYFAIQDIKQKYGFDYKHKATLKNINKIRIRIPVDSSDNFDLNAQKDTIEKSKMIKELKIELKKQFMKVSSAQINLD